MNNSGFASNYATSTSETPGCPLRITSATSWPAFTPRRNCRSSISWQRNSRFATIGSRRFRADLAKSLLRARRLFGGLDRQPPSRATRSAWLAPRADSRYETDPSFTRCPTAEASVAPVQRQAEPVQRRSSGPEFGGWISQVASLKGISQLDMRSMDSFASDLQEKDKDNRIARPTTEYSTRSSSRISAGASSRARSWQQRNCTRGPRGADLQRRLFAASRG